MKLVTYSLSGAVQVGLIGTDAEKVVPIRALGFTAADMNGFIDQLQGASPAALLEQVDAAPGDPLAQCRLLAPIQHPRQDVVCLGVNYYEHRDETLASNIKYDGKLSKPVYFSKRVNEAVAPGEAIDSHTGLVECLDYEVELAVILGKDASKVPLDQVEDYILGYTILNDVSARDLQSAHQQWYFGKSLDGFTPIGPWIVTKDELAWMPKLAIRSFVNGELRQNNNTERMMTGIDAAIHQLSQGITLKAGTILAMGTPSGVGMAFNPTRYMHPGDVVRCEIEGIGVLENPVR
ncbi:fumarylacetoacetate hydrolase family protein [uncultured Oscillibacter sp.]|uniref:fumarylacetoacetate hydrolase family protein n=1 Tax=uncultured Oscillibacter sp. TaxID=876091 RepID=UPI0025EE004B|nr:fumarylacetoacetate hydrolase family protein [uncultured Oscillibacter sp.]